MLINESYTSSLNELSRRVQQQRRKCYHAGSRGRLYCIPVSGIGNRLNLLASAMALAETHEPVRVKWTIDEHFSLSFRETFGTVPNVRPATEKMPQEFLCLKHFYFPVNAGGMPQAQFTCRIREGFELLRKILLQRWSESDDRFDLGCHVRRFSHLPRLLSLEELLEPIRAVIRRISRTGRIGSVLVVSDDEEVRRMVSYDFKSAADRVVASSAAVSNNDWRTPETSRSGLRDLMRMCQCDHLLVNTATSTYTDLPAYCGVPRYFAVADHAVRACDDCFVYRGVEDLITSLRRFPIKN